MRKATTLDAIRRDEAVMVGRGVVDPIAFEGVLKEVEGGQELTFEHIGRVFGADFWMMLVYALMDAQEAARAIQGAINRLRTEASVDPIEPMDPPVVTPAPVDPPVDPAPVAEEVTQ